MSVFSIVVMLGFCITAQLASVFFLPATNGFTKLLPSLLTVASLIFSVVLMARIIQSGVNLSTLMPIIAATVPLGAIVIGILAYGDPASLPKVAALVGACILIGVANIL